MYKPHTHHHLYDKCKSHMNKYVLAETTDGQKFDGIIVDVDAEQVILAVPITGEEMMYGYDGMMMDSRVYGYPYGFNPGFGFYPPFYGFPRRRFRRLALPLAALTAISLLPWF
jgi:hypothetical protein